MKLAASLLGVLSLAILRGSALAQTAPSKPQPLILSPDTCWRMYPVWRTEVCKTGDGKMVPVDWDARLVRNDSNQWVSVNHKVMIKDKQAYRLKPAPRTEGSSWPDGQWTSPDFDDSAWDTWRGTIKQGYRCLALIALRGKFEVKDPVQVQDVSLTVAYRGGVVVSVNGQEVGRSNMPAGSIASETLADEYSLEAFLNADGFPVKQIRWYYPTWNDYETSRANEKGYDDVMKQRTRTATITIPASALRKGVNVVSVEIHRAPAREEMFLKNLILDPSQKRYGSVREQRWQTWWDRCSMEDIRLVASATGDAVVPNLARAKGFRVGNTGSFEVNDAGSYYADPNETLRPVRLCGLKNGSYWAQVVVDSDAPIKGLVATASDLTGKGGTIPAACLQIAYNEPGLEWHNSCDWGFHRLFREKLENAPLKEIPVEKDRNGKPSGAMQPVSLIVTVPKTTPPGTYVGKVTIVAENEKPVEVPVEMTVVGNWTLPEARDFWLYMSFVQSPDSLAMYYDVPMWSEAHWKLIEKSFAVLGQLGNKEVVIPLISETHAGNAHTMAYWVKQTDGSYEVDWTNVERYLDLAVKHCGKLPDVCFIIPYGFYSNWSRPHAQLFTVRDAATGELKEETAPDWGTPEALAFWQPVADHIREMLKKRGLENSTTIWNTQFSCAKKEALADLKKLLPEAKYMGRSHLCWDANPRGNFLTVSWKDTAAGVLWDPDEDQPWYHWRIPGAYVLHFNGADILGRSTAPSIMMYGGLSGYRITPEMTTVSGVAGQNGLRGVMEVYVKRGLGQCAADFWQVLKNDKGERKGNLLNKYCNEMQHPIFWPCVLEPGRDGPVGTLRVQMLREGLQDSEARMFVQNAVLDRADKLGPELARKAKAVCDERTRSFRYYTECLATPWQGEVKAQARRLYEVADEVAKALGR